MTTIEARRFDVHSNDGMRHSEVTHRRLLKILTQHPSAVANIGGNAKFNDGIATRIKLGGVTSMVIAHAPARSVTMGLGAGRLAG